MLLLDGLNMAAIKENFDLPRALHPRYFHVVRTYDMRDCYVANAAPKAKTNKYALGEKKSLQDLIIDGKQVKARENEQHVLKYKRKRQLQTTSDHKKRCI